ncbi:TPA: hypothetical protein ACIS6J_004480, partial [Salmonella enterica subsp. enterica serovar Enteritidis]
KKKIRVVAYSIKTRIARAGSRARAGARGTQINHFLVTFCAICGKPDTSPSGEFLHRKPTGLSADFVNNKKRLTGGWPHCVTPTTIPSVFSRAVVNH